MTSGSEHRQRTALVGVRLYPDEYQRLIDAAALEGLSAPALLRARIEDVIRPQPTHSTVGFLPPAGHHENPSAAR